MTYVEINNNRYVATIGGKMHDREWNDRESKYIHAEMTYNEAISNFIDGANWSIVQIDEVEVEKHDDKGNVYVDVEKIENVFDNSEFSMAGEVIDHRDGTVTIKMGKPNELEVALSTIDEILIAMED